ncbi:MAG: PAS domain-containing protein [Betaproteobacteria bacterium]
MSGFVLRRPIVLGLLALGILFALDLFTLKAHKEAQRAAEFLDRRDQSVGQLHALALTITDMQNGMRGFLLTGSSVSLNRYRQAAEGFPAANQAALGLLDDDAGRQTLKSVSVATQDWLDHVASPLVVNRGAGADIADIAETMRKRQEDAQARRVTLQLGELIKAEEARGSEARTALGHRLDDVTAWMHRRTLALLVALAALTLMLVRTRAKLVGQTRSRELAENAMRSTFATLRAMSEASPLGMFFADGSGACLQSNADFARVAGLSESELLGNGWLSTLHPEDRDRVAAAWAIAVKTGTPFVSMHRFAHRDGKVVWASMQSAKMSDGGQLIGYACSIEDISARREADEALRNAEGRLHLALETTQLLLFDWHVPSGEMLLSGPWNALTGRDMQSPTTTARRLNDLVHVSDREALRGAIVEAFKNNKAFSVEFRMSAPARQWKRVRAGGHVTERDSTGRAVRLLGTVTAMD